MTLNFSTKLSNSNQKKNINRPTMNKFIIKLSYETCDSIFDSSDVGSVFIYFFNTHVKNLYSIFPIQNEMRKSKLMLG